MGHLRVINSKFTNSLPESYAPLIVQLDAMEESHRTISHVITRLIGEERRQAGEEWEKDREEDSLALLAARRRRRDRSEVICFGCGEKGHYRSNCPKEQGTNEEPTTTSKGTQPKLLMSTLY